ncbi:MAG: IS3 family transposase, partial [Oscillospiraceae bacterium]
LCAVIDLHNREIIGYSAGKNKTAELVKEAIQRINRPLSDIKIFHTDRGSEFKNKEIDDIISAFGITRSLSHKGCPYDNAVAEATYNIIKTEFVFGEKFDSLQELSLKYFDYVNWYNTKRIHGSLSYLSPVDFRQSK